MIMHYLGWGRRKGCNRIFINLVQQKTADMKTLISILSLIITVTCFGQTNDSLFQDNNPIITDAEAAWLNTNFNTANFDFKNKYIGLIDVVPAFYGIGKFTFSMLKKGLSNINLDEIAYKVVVLDSADKARTKGYDAILIISSKGHKGKIERLKHETIIYKSENHYTDIPSDAGLDSSPVLTKENALFLRNYTKWAGLSTHYMI